MKIGIIGLPQTGKKTLFQLITGYRIAEKDYVSDKSLISAAEVKDPRFDFLVELYKPKKEVRARVTIELLPKLDRDVIQKGEIFRNIADVDAVCHVVRAFADDSVYHSEGSVDPLRDIYSINSELLLHDQVFVEKRIERLDKGLAKIKDKNALAERELMCRFRDHLEKELPLRTIVLERDEIKAVSGYPLITLKKMIIALNTGEDDIADTDKYEGLRSSLDEGTELIVVCARAEGEIAELENPGERAEFMDALGIREPAVNLLTRVCIKMLDLISFFTVGADEVRQWPLRRGSSAPEAAGVIHSDLQKGFIRAEVMKYNDLHESGSEEKLKESGRFHVKGKDYIVEDGDILCIRFNV